MTTVDEAREGHCAGCQGWYVTADPEPTGEPGDPYQVQCAGMADIERAKTEARAATLDEARAAVADEFARSSGTWTLKAGLKALAAIDALREGADRGA